MSRLTLVLFVAVAGLAMLVIQVRQQHRVTFSELQRIERQGDEAAMERQRLVLEQQSWLEFWRVEKAAKSRLDMREPDEDSTLVIRYAKD